jgi:hypothetical protein
LGFSLCDSEFQPKTISFVAQAVKDTWSNINSESNIKAGTLPASEEAQCVSCRSRRAMMPSMASDDQRMTEQQWRAACDKGRELAEDSALWMLHMRALKAGYVYMRFDLLAIGRAILLGGPIGQSWATLKRQRG